HEHEPGEPDRALAEVAHVGVKRFGAGYGEDYRSEQNERGAAMMQEKLKTVPRIRCCQNLRRLGDLTNAEQSDADKPHRHYRSENAADFGGAVLLKEEKHGEDGHRQRNDEMLRLGCDHLEAFD